MLFSSSVPVWFENFSGGYCVRYIWIRISICIWLLLLVSSIVVSVSISFESLLHKWSSNVVLTSFFHCQLYNCGGYVDVEGQMNSTDFVDDISITFLYVSSSDLVLKIINTENYHFLYDTKYHKQGCRMSDFHTCHQHARA